MAKITINANYDGHLIKEFIKDYNIAFAEGDADFIIASATDDIVWKMMGDKEMIGIEEFTKEINILKDYTADEMIINSIIVDGNQASADGWMKMGGKAYAFSDVYVFAENEELKIKALRSYGISLT